MGVFLLTDVTHSNERVRFSGKNRCPLQPPKATKNFIFRELLVVLRTFCKSA